MYIEEIDQIIEYLMNKRISWLPYNVIKKCIRLIKVMKNK